MPDAVVNLDAHRKQKVKKAHVWPREPNNWYVEPEWCSVRLFAMEAFAGDVWDPFAGTGRIPVAARAAGLMSYGTDLLDRGLPEPLAGRVDFMSDELKGVTGQVANIVANPPYDRDVASLVNRALQLASQKIALLLPHRWIVAHDRSLWLEKTPLKRVLCLTPRPSLPPGQIALNRPDEFLVPDPELLDGQPANGNVDFAWYIWEHGYVGPWTGGWCRRDDGGDDGAGT